MKVRNLVPWAGPNFSYQPDDEIELPDDVAQARIEAGLCAAIEEKPAGKAAKAAPKADAQTAG